MNVKTLGGDPGAAVDALRARARAVAKAVVRTREALERPDSQESAKAIHELRVATRKASAALSALEPVIAEEDAARLKRRTRAVRRAAGAVRDCDVHAQILSSVAGAGGAGLAEPARGALRRIAAERAGAIEDLRGVLDRPWWRHKAGPLKREVRIVRDARNAADLEAHAADTLGRLTAAVREAAQRDLGVLHNLHQVRLAVKRLRYGVMVFEPAWVGDASRRVLEEAQQRLGEVNDVCTLVERLEGWQRGPAGVPEGLVALRDRFITIRDLRATRAVEWWQANGGAVLTMAPSAGPAATEPVAAPAAAIAVEPAGTNGDHRPDPRAVQGDLWMSGLRVAVIDIGSNSIRLLAVEVIDRTSWRVLAEERAQTRLVQGMAAGGVLCPEAMARSVEAIAGFKRLAEERGVGTIRAYATAAVRDADNREAFISLVRERAGLTLEIVSARDEGSLTYRSVARVFDLEGQDAAVVDIGGGSLEVVQARHGVVIANASMPLGAVRVTERFGGAEVCCAAGYGAMSRWVRRHLRRKVRTGEGPPAVLVGCGGTFTTLLTLAAATRGFMIERNSPGLAGLGPVSRVQVRRLLRSLRGTPLAERLRVPGLPADRADIIVAGLTVVYRLMKHLGAMQVRVHPGGFREGLLLRLIEREAGTRAAHSEATDAQRLAGARAFAARSGYDRDHSEHVATLAVSLFDQLRQESDFIPGLGTAEHERVMLECAAVLHDVGMLVEYRRHHRHGETMVRHADLPGWSEREVEIIAQVVRYHRRASPRSTHRAFEALPESDRALVRRLAGILRVADGLDRCHARNCSSVHLRFGPRGVQIDVAAREGAPKDLKAARKKSDLLSRLLGQPLRIVPAEQNAV